MSKQDLTDESPMPFGKYKGVAMVNVPASYLIWLWDQGKCYMEVKTYIKENLDALRLEVKNEKFNTK